MLAHLGMEKNAILILPLVSNDLDTILALCPYLEGVKAFEAVFVKGIGLKVALDQGICSQYLDLHHSDLLTRAQFGSPGQGQYLHPRTDTKDRCGSIPKPSKGIYMI